MLEDYALWPDLEGSEDDIISTIVDGDPKEAQRFKNLDAYKKRILATRRCRGQNATLRDMKIIPIGRLTQMTKTIVCGLTLD